MNTKFFKCYFLKKPFVRFSLSILSTLFFLMICMLIVSKVLSVKQNKELNVVMKSITYTEQNADKELALLETYTNRDFLSEENYAKLYKAMAEIVFMTGEHSLYNKYVANALYYFEQVDDVESVVYLTNKYIGLLYSSGCYEAAWQVLQRLSSNYDISSVSIDLQISYYLSCADVAQMLGENDKEVLKKASDCIKKMPESGERQLLQAKCDLLTARNYIQMQDYELAKKTVLKYSAHDEFGLGTGQVYVVCDFQIPYYEIMAKILLNEENYASAYEYIDLYIDFCDEYNFVGMKLMMLQYIENNADENSVEKYQLLKKESIQENIITLRKQQAVFLLQDVKNTISDNEKNAKKKKLIVQDIVFKIFIIYGIVIVYYFILYCLDYAYKDALTGLYNRHIYQKKQQMMEKKGIYHSLLILDVDNFKMINDTFGHQRGDYVLRKIGEILQGYSNDNIFCFRYGGEELCAFFLNMPEDRVREIAENIRQQVHDEISTEEMNVTVSGGIGVSIVGENVFSLADQRLYEAKTNGKNQII